MNKRRFIGHTIGKYGVIEGEEFHHLVKVLRAYVGMEFILITKKGESYDARVEKIDKKNKRVLARLGGLLENKDTTEDGGIYVAFALIVENRLRFLLEKCTEVGVKGFMPFVAQRSKRKSEKLRDGWLKVIESAVKQSRRAYFPTIYGIANLDATLEKAESIGDIHLLDREGVWIDHINLEKKDHVIFIGPEGGFTIDEKNRIRERARHVVRLGDNVLRSETAAMVASYEFINKIKAKGGEVLVRSSST